jgi:hypothetical protein
MISLIFYAWGDLVNLPVLLLYILMNYAAGRMISGPCARAIMALGVAGNLALLVAFKYAGFLTEQLNAVLNAVDYTSLPVRKANGSLIRCHTATGKQQLSYAACAMMASSPHLCWIARWTDTTSSPMSNKSLLQL